MSKGVPVYQANVEVNGREYLLQHPGTVQWMRLRQTMLVVHAEETMTIDNVKMLEYAFEHVVFPVKGPKLKLENWDPRDQAVLEEVWQPLLLNFLRGRPIARTYSDTEWDKVQAAARVDAAEESGAGEEESGSGDRDSGPRPVQLPRSAQDAAGSVRANARAG